MSATIFQLSGMFSSSFTSSSLKAPSQHDPTSIAHAAMTMFCRAIVVSMIVQLPLSVFAHPIIVSGASLMNQLTRPHESFCFNVSSVMVMKCHGCPFPAEGACRPASRMLFNTGVGMGFFV